MSIMNTLSLKSNRHIKINFAGGDLSSDAGLILIKEFTCKLGFVKLLESLFKISDTALFRHHKNDENLWQVIYQILGAYFKDDFANELIHDVCKYMLWHTTYLIDSNGWYCLQKYISSRSIPFA